MTLFDLEWAVAPEEPEKPKSETDMIGSASLPMALLLVACLVYVYFIYDPAIMRYAPAINGFVSVLLMLVAIYFISK